MFGSEAPAGPWVSAKAGTISGDGPMKSFVRGLVVLAILAGAGFAGIVYLAQSTAPQSSPVERTLSNDSFPR